MRIQYSLSRFDLLLGQILVIFISPFFRYLMLALLCLLIYVTYPEQERDNLRPMLYFAIIGPLTVLTCTIVIATIIFVIAVLLTYIPSHRGVLGTHTIEILDEGLLESTDYNQTISKWSSHFRVIKTFGYIFIFLSEFTFLQIPTNQLSQEEVTHLSSSLKKALETADI